MDTFLTIASKRDQRAYADREIPADLRDRIVDAGRIAGSAQNRQPLRFFVLESRDVVERLAQTVYVADNILGARLVVALVAAGRPGFDAGRAAQNMMLAAHADGVGGCPNGIADRDGAAAALGHSTEERVAIVLSFGYPARARDPESRPAEEWVRRADRKPFDEVVERVD